MPKVAPRSARPPPGSRAGAMESARSPARAARTMAMRPHRIRRRPGPGKWRGPMRAARRSPKLCCRSAVSRVEYPSRGPVVHAHDRAGGRIQQTEPDHRQRHLREARKMLRRDPEISCHSVGTSTIAKPARRNWKNKSIKRPSGDAQRRQHPPGPAARQVINLAPHWVSDIRNPNKSRTNQLNTRPGNPPAQRLARTDQ